MPSSSNALPSILALLLTVSYLFPASVARAVFSFHAVLAVLIALVIKSPEPASARIVLLSLTSESFISSSIAIADLPFLSVSLRPPMNAPSADTASVLNVCLNCSPVMLATDAYCPSASELVSTASCIFFNSLAIVEPPDSALMPTELIAVASAIICACDNPTR